MNGVLARWNQLPAADAIREIISCCGSKTWVQRLAGCRPVASEAALLTASDEIWRSLAASDWLEAFHSHPRIGETATRASVAAHSSSWSREEQSNVAAAGDTVRMELAIANRSYEQKFGHIFIVCATGKSAAEILAILHRRMQNDGKTELHEAAEQQRQITQLRLKRWLGI